MATRIKSNVVAMFVRKRDDNLVENDMYTRHSNPDSQDQNVEEGREGQ